MPTKNELLQRILERYGSLERPDFGWVQIEYDRDPHEGLRRRLSSRFDLNDITDLNSDVSFAYDLKPKRGEGNWTLRLSMVGSYATLIRHALREADEMIVDRPSDAKSEEEAFIVETCQAVGSEVLRREVLGFPVGLHLFDAAPERVRAYQALFTDVDFLPGEYAAEANGEKISNSN